MTLFSRNKTLTLIMKFILVELLFLLQIQMAAATNLSLRWRWTNPTPHGNNIIDQAFNPAFQLTVQVTDSGQVYSSSDVDTWIPRDTGVTNYLRGVAFYGNRIIIVGEEGLAMYTDDLNTFMKGNLAPTSDWLEAVATSSNLVVAVGDNGAIYYSSDGTSWTRCTVPFNTWLRGVAYGGSGFVAVGENGFIAASADGINWTQSVSPVPQTLNRVYWNDQYFTIVGNNGIVLTNAGPLPSASWYSVNSGATNALNTAAGSILAQRVVAGYSEVRLTDNGTWGNELAKTNGPPDWTYISSFAFPGTAPWCLLAGRSGMIVEGFKTNSAGYNWFLQSKPVRNWLWDLTYMSHIYVTVGDFGTIMSSLDGLNWSLELPPDTMTNKIIFGVGGTTNMLVAVGESGNIIFSTNSHSPVIVTNLVGTNMIVSTNQVSNLGILWSPAQSATTNDLQGIDCFNGLYIAAGDAGTLLTSVNASNWTARTSPTNKVLTSVSAYPKGVVAVGERGTILQSGNGINWTNRSLATTNWIYRVRYLNGQLIAVGQNGLFTTSTNGIIWTPPTSITSRWLNDVTYVNGVYYTIGTQGACLASTNTTTWTNLGTITVKSLYGLASDGNRLVVAGTEGALLRAQLRTPTNAVQPLGFSHTKDTNNYYNVFLFTGQPDQKFIIESANALSPTNWVIESILEMVDPSGTMYYQEVTPITNAEPRQFFRTRLYP
jgi:hypothetical protein